MLTMLHSARLGRLCFVCLVKGYIHFLVVWSAVEAVLAAFFRTLVIQSSEAGYTQTVH